MAASQGRDIGKKLNTSYLFGVACQKYIDKDEEKQFKPHKTELKDLADLDQFCWKMNKMAQMTEYLMDKTEKHEDRLNNDNKRMEKLIEESFRRLEDKMNNGLGSFEKTINDYFGQTNQKVSSLDALFNTLKKTHESKFDDINVALGRRISDNNLKSALDAAETKIKKDL